MLAVVKTMDTQNQPEFDYWDAFWTLYPRREAKKDAMKAWSQISTRAYDAILVAVVEWRKIWAAQGRDSSRIPMPATWLRGERWEDELPVEFAQNPARPMTVLPELPRKSGEIPEKVKAMLAKLKGQTC